MNGKLEDNARSYASFLESWGGVGTIAEIIPDQSTNFYVLKIKTAANFQNLQQVMVVENLQYDDQDKLLKETKKIIEDPKKRTRWVIL